MAANLAPETRSRRKETVEKSGFKKHLFKRDFPGTIYWPKLF
jgi:hypothetical protein